MGSEDQSAVTIVKRIGYAIRDGGDRYCLRIIYRGAKGVRKDRFISPTSWCDDRRQAFHALCLTTGETRRMYVNRVERAIFIPSWDVLIPMEQTVLAAEEATE